MLQTPTEAITQFLWKLEICIFESTSGAVVETDNPINTTCFNNDLLCQHQVCLIALSQFANMKL